VIFNAYTYKRGELLTKSWLMGVRRGWLSLLEPHIVEWKDVLKAIGKLDEFVRNLREQILFVRRNPLTLPNSEEGKKLLKQFDTLLNAIDNQHSTAAHWMDVDQRSDFRSLGFSQEEGAHMFELYKTKFSDMMTTYVRTRRKPGQYITTREANLTELLDKILDTLREGASRLEKAIKIEEATQPLGISPTLMEYKEPAFKEFSFGRMKVIVVGTQDSREYIKRLDKAYQLIQKKGFEKLWYGVLFVSRNFHKLDPDSVEAYRIAGYKDLQSRAGAYHSGSDIMEMTAPPTKWLSDAIIHELGHRYWFKFMKSPQRARFVDLIKVNIPGKSGILIPEKINDQLLTNIEKNVYDNHIKVARALEAFQKDTQFFSKAIAKATDVLFNVVSNFVKVVFKAIENLSTYVLPSEDPHVKEKWQQVQKYLNACEVWVKKLFELENKIQSLPDGTDFQKVFDEERTEWVIEMHARIMEAEGAAYQLIIDLNEVQNRKIEEAKKERDPHLDPSDPRPIFPVSEYGKSNAEEAFAEAFEHYVTGKDMNRDQLESFRSVLASKRVLSAQQVVNRFLNAY